MGVFLIYLFLKKFVQHISHQSIQFNRKSNFDPILILFHILSKGRFQKKKKVRNFPHFSGVGGFEKVIFRKRKKKIWSQNA